MALKIGCMGHLVRLAPKFLDSWESHHLSKAALKRSLNFSIFITTSGTLILAHCVKRLLPTQRKRVSNFFKDDVDFSVHFHKKSVKKYHVFDWMCVRTLARNCKISSYIIYIAAALELQYTIIMNFKSSRIPYVNWISNADVLKRLYSHEKGLKGILPILKKNTSCLSTLCL